MRPSLVMASASFLKNIPMSPLMSVDVIHSPRITFVILVAYFHLKPSTPIHKHRIYSVMRPWLSNASVDLLETFPS